MPDRFFHTILSRHFVNFQLFFFKKFLALHYLCTLMCDTSGVCSVGGGGGGQVLLPSFFFKKFPYSAQLRFNSFQSTREKKNKGHIKKKAGA